MVRKGCRKMAFSFDGRSLTPWPLSKEEGRDFVDASNSFV